MFRGSLIKHCRTHGLILSQRFGRCYFGPPPIEILHLGSYRTERRDKFSQRCISKKNHRLNSMASKLTNADLVLNALTKVTEGKERHRLIDVGINLADSSYDKDREQVIERAKQAGVVALVITGCDLKTSRKAQEIAHQHQGVYFTAGVHPHNAKDCGEATLDSLRGLISDSLCVAVGECGLDFNRNFSPADVQEEWFDKQVQLACELRKPLFLHCRDAAQQFSAILRPINNIRATHIKSGEFQYSSLIKVSPNRRRHELTAPAVAHCFTGNGTELQEMLSLGLHIGITGWVCDERPDRGGVELANLVKLVPKDKLMIETDGPYITPRTIRPNKARPKRNEPALLPYVLQTVAEHMGEPESQVAARTTATAKAFFGIQKELVS